MRNKNESQTLMRSDRESVLIPVKAEVKLSSTSFSYIPFNYTFKLKRSSGISVLSSMNTGCRKEESLFRQATFSETMSNIIMSVVESGEYADKKSASFSDEFYEECVSLYEKSIALKVEDREFCIIQTKQLAIILRSGGLLDSGRKSVYDNDALYKELFASFWNLAMWDHLFPSMPQTAQMMREDRYLIAELLLSRKGVFCVDDIARDYFCGQNIPMKNYMLYISFFDYSFFTWMRNFGIIKFCSSHNGRVKAKLTAWGHSFLESIE